jgi:hypothetical protein
MGRALEGRRHEYECQGGANHDSNNNAHYTAADGSSAAARATVAPLRGGRSVPGCLERAGHPSQSRAA